MSGVERANGHRPTGLVDIFHPAPRSAPRPDQSELDYDLAEALNAIPLLTAEVPEDAFTAQSLGSEREGSGVVIGDDGLVLTIGYLIVEATEVTLTMAGGRTVPADVVAYDHETGFGLVRAVSDLGVKPVPLGESKNVRVGDKVVIASHGGFDHSVAARIVSRREFCGSWEYMLEDSLFSAPMHPFWGGAALLDNDGKLIGVGSLYVEDTTGNNTSLPGNMFVPIDLLPPIFDEMVSTGRAQREPRPWLGLHAVEVEDQLLVSGVASDGPADAAGIVPTDVVLSIESEPVNTLSDMYRTLWSLGSAGVDLKIAVLRDDDVIEMRVYSGDRYEFLRLPRRH